MDTLVLRTLDRYTKPNYSQLIGNWSPSRHRNKINIQCMYHKDGKVFILNKSERLVVLNDEDYFESIGKNASNFINPYQPKTFVFDTNHPEYHINSTTDAYKFFAQYPHATIDGKSNGGNPLIYITNESVELGKSVANIKLKIKVNNFITGLDDSQLKDIVYFFGRTPKETTDELLDQILNEKTGMAWSNDSIGNLIAKEIDKTFIEKTKEKGDIGQETTIKILCNKAINFNAIVYRPGLKGGAGAYYWGDTFLGVSKEEIYAYFRNDNRFFESLKNEVSRITGEVSVKDTELLKPEVRTKPDRIELWRKLQELESQGFAEIVGLDFRKTKREDLERLVAEAELKAKTPVV